MGRHFQNIGTLGSFKLLSPSSGNRAWRVIQDVDCELSVTEKDASARTEIYLIPRVTVLK